MVGQTPPAREARVDVAESRPVSRMSPSDRGRIVRELESLSGDYELERIDGEYRVTREGEVLTSMHVSRCGDGVHLFVGDAPRV